VPPSEDVERQVAVRAVVAVIEAAFLASVQRIVGGIEVEDDALRGRSCAAMKMSRNTCSSSASFTLIL
jgi:hypothetical protein